LLLKWRFEPPVHIQQDPLLVGVVGGVVGYCLENQVVIKVVEGSLDHYL
jgi:hypothetical protein